MYTPHGDIGKSFRLTQFKHKTSLHEIHKDVTLYFLLNEKKNPFTCRLLMHCFCIWSEVGSPILGFFGLPVVPFFFFILLQCQLYPKSSVHICVDLFLVSMLWSIYLSIIMPIPYHLDYYNCKSQYLLYGFPTLSC